jgi:hypothetical protein
MNRGRARRSVSLEALEGRRLLAVAQPLADNITITSRGTLVVKGTDEADVIAVQRSGGAVTVSFGVGEGVTAVKVFLGAETKRVLVEAGGGDDK